MEEIKWSLVWPLLALQALLAVIGLFSLRKAEATRGPKWLWLIILIFGNLLGSIAYFTFGRKDA
ncbi:PLD nuclease N-terminal domain-containing protein [Paenibacillus sp. BR2-3]|uniref:PLD nuclease N-terminal domain-containing protein n=1 Tax=Paenibacillus sp. BR2-3 TaxID=3048494 RepID=UPI0039777828